MALRLASDLGFFGILNFGGDEIILVFSMVLILFGAKKLPELARGLGQGINMFWGSCRKLGEGLDGQASDAGRSVSGIYGKAAAQAITVNNQVAELYDPAVLGERKPFVSHKKRPMKVPAAFFALFRLMLGLRHALKARFQRAFRGPA